MYKVEDIIHLLSHTSRVIGDLKQGFDKIGDAENIDETTLDWIHPNKNNAHEYLIKSPAKVIIAPIDLYNNELEYYDNKTIIFTENPILLFSRIVSELFMKKPESGIHPSAIIDAEASIGENVYVGPFCYIGKCEIADGCVMHSHVSIEDGIIIGKNVLIKSGARIGYPGFGFVKNEDGEYEKFPQVGKVVIKDGVEIGANTCIDRGSLSDTIIGENVKISSICHISHNVVIEENTIITGQVMISGSSKIEANVWIGPNATIREHKHVGQSALIGAGSVVVCDIPGNQIWAGNPARYLRDRKQ